MDNGSVIVGKRKNSARDREAHHIDSKNRFELSDIQPNVMRNSPSDPVLERMDALILTDYSPSNMLVRNAGK